MPTELTETVVDQPNETDNSGIERAVVAGGAGLVGMVAMAPVLGIAWLVGALQPSAFAGLAEIVGLGPNFVVGALIFVLGGMVTLPLLFVSLAVFLPGRTVAIRGLSYATIVWTGFVVAFYSGETGAMLALFLGITLVAHWVYGYVLGFLYDRYATIPIYDV